MAALGEEAWEETLVDEGEESAEFRNIRRRAL